MVFITIVTSIWELSMGFLVDDESFEGAIAQCLSEVHAQPFAGYWKGRALFVTPDLVEMDLVHIPEFRSNSTQLVQEGKPVALWNK
jgi:hypothetical protein